MGRNPLEEMTLASPAIAGDSLYIRTQSKLYRLSELYSTAREECFRELGHPAAV